MANLKEVRNRITSVNSTRQITSAMKMVSASKLRRAQNAILKMRPYASKLREILGNLSQSVEAANLSVYSQQREVRSVLLIVIASNRGLCGAFNSNIIKTAVRQINEVYPEQNKNGKLSVLCIGRKVSEYFTKRGYQIYDADNRITESLTFENTVPISERVLKSFSDKEFDKVEIIYNQFRNAAYQVIVTEPYLPVIPPEKTEIQKQVDIDYIFEPDKETIVLEVIPKTLKIQFYKALLDSVASEHGARMTAMHKATDNATEMIKDLKLVYNKARQAAITKEIIEIVSGAEALKG